MNERSNFYNNTIDDPRKIPFFDDSILPVNANGDRSFRSYNSQEIPFSSSYNPNFYRIPASLLQHNMLGFSDANTPFHNNKQTMDDLIINTNKLGSWSTNYRNMNTAQALPLLEPNCFPPNHIGFTPQLVPFLIHNRATGNNLMAFGPDANLNSNNELPSVSSTTTIDSGSFYNFGDPVNNYTLNSSNNCNNSSSNSYSTNDNTGNNNPRINSSNEVDNSISTSQSTNDIFTNVNPGIATPNFAPFEPNYFDINPEEFSKTPLNKLTNTGTLNNNYDISQSVLSTPNLSSNKHSRFFPSPKSERVRPYGSILAIQNGSNAFHSLDNTPTSAIPNLTDKITFLNLSSNIFPPTETISSFRDISAFPIDDDNLISMHPNSLDIQPLANSQQISNCQGFLSHDSSFNMLEQGSNDPFDSCFPVDSMTKALNSDPENFQLHNSMKSKENNSNEGAAQETQKMKNTFAPYSENLFKPSVSLHRDNELLRNYLVPRTNSSEDSIIRADKKNQKLKHDNNNNVKDTLVSLCAFNLKEDSKLNVDTRNSEIEKQNMQSTELPIFDDYAYSFPEGFSSTFYKRVDNNFMFVREIQSKSTVLKFRSNSILELRLSIPSLPLFEVPDESRKEDRKSFTIDTNNKAIPKKKKYKSFVVKMNLHDLEGKISGLKVSKQLQTNCKSAIAGDAKGFDSEGKATRNSHLSRNDKTYQGSKTFYKRGLCHNSNYKKKRKSAVQIN